MLAQLDVFLGPEVQWFALSPLLTLLGGALGLLLVGALTPAWPKRLYAIVSATTAGAAGVLAMVLWDDISDRGPITLVGGAIALEAANPAYETRVYRDDQVKVQGRLVGLIRTY